MKEVKKESSIPHMVETVNKDQSGIPHSVGVTRSNKPRLYALGACERVKIRTI